MKFFINHNCDPAFNLALEELLAGEFDDDILMLWRNAPAIIVGRNQNTAAEIDGDYVRSRGIQVVRRITGGGAVYHDLGNVNYTLALTGRKLDAGAFAEYAAPVVEGLRKLAIPAEFSGRNDILADGVKVSGSAKSVLRNRTLFHGTMLFDVDLNVLADALRPDTGKISSKGIKSVRSRVGNLRKYHPEWTVEQFIDHLGQTLCSEFGISVRSELPEPLLSRAGDLADEKYRTWEWNYGTVLNYSFSKSARFAGGVVKVEFNVSGNRLDIPRFSGDFFGIRPVAELAGRLAGAEFRSEALAAALDGVVLEDYMIGISRGELLSLFE